MLSFLYAYLMNYLQNEEGQGLVEYALILALISVVAIAVMILVGGNVVDVFTGVGDAMTGAG